MLLSAALFMRSFLDLPRTAPRLNLLALAFITVYTLVLLSQPFIDKRLGNTLGLYGGIVIFPLLLGSGLWFSLVRRERPAHFYLLGWLAAGAGGLYFAIEQLNYVAAPLRGIDGLKLGIALEALILSLALADQMRTVRLQRDRNQRALLDLTEQRLRESEQLAAVEREKRQALEQAQRAGEKLAHTSHDLRSPLYALRLALRSARGLDEDGAVSRQLEQSFTYMEALLSGLVTDNRDQQNELASEPLGELVARCVLRQQEAADAADIELRSVRCSQPNPVPGAVLERIVDNLLGNAIRYSPRGTVLVGVRRRSNGLELQVCDQGPGIHSEDVERLTQAFQQGNACAAESEGYGLGLAIVDTLCREIGAELIIRSEPGRGSVFAVLLPPKSALKPPQPAAAL
jgi:signal transduction histidine kinase